MINTHLERFECSEREIAIKEKLLSHHDGITDNYLHFADGMVDIELC